MNIPSSEGHHNHLTFTYTQNNVAITSYTYKAQITTIPSLIHSFHLSQFLSRSYKSILPTSLTYVMLLITRGY